MSLGSAAILWLFGIVAAASPPAFRVLTQQSESALWAKVDKELAAEPGPLGVTASRKLQWVAVAGGAVLALVEWRESDAWEVGWSEAYSLPESADSHQKLGAKPVAWAMQFEAEVERDTVLFTGLSCTECEPSKLLVGFVVDPVTHTWSRLLWRTEKGDHDVFPLDATADEGWEQVRCAVGVLPPRALAVWCRELDEHGKDVSSTTERLTREGATYVRSAVAGDAARDLRIALCRRALPTAPCEPGSLPER